MPAEITMPQLSDTMTEGTVVKWLKKEGDTIAAGEVIAEVETDKATMEMESFESGTVAHLRVPEGGKVKVGDAIAILATGKETVADVKKNGNGGAPIDSGTARHVSNPEAKLDAREEERAKGNHPAHASTTAVATPTTRGDAQRQRVSPLARRIAGEHGVDLSSVNGTGPGGRIVQADVLAAAKGERAGNGSVKETKPIATSQAKPSAPSVPLPQRVATGQKEVVALSKMRTVIATRLQQSKQQLPHFYETIDIDCEAIAGLRERLNKQLDRAGVKLSFSDFINKAIAAALLQHPTVNAHFNGAKNEITKFGDVHLGIAVALPDGLIVPVLRNIDQMGLKEIRQRSVDLADRARGGKLKQDELTGATFSVSTLGAYGVREFSAIINPPEVGILAVGAVEKRAVVRNDQVVARTMMSVTLSVDHRVVDGATAAEFLRTLKSLLEEPGLMLA